MKQIMVDRLGSLLTNGELNLMIEELIDEDGGCRATLELEQGDAMYGWDLACNLPADHDGPHYAEVPGIRWRESG